MRPQDLATAKTVAKISVVSNTAGGKKSVAADPQVLTIPRARNKKYQVRCVGRTGFEPVTSSVSGKSRAVPGVYRRRPRSNWEPMTCEKILTESGSVGRRLIVLALIPGSHGPGEWCSQPFLSVVPVIIPP
jgi:hypothetical protein